MAALASLASVLVIITIGNLISSSVALRGRILLKRVGEADLDYMRWDPNPYHLCRNIIRARTGTRARIMLVLLVGAIILSMLEAISPLGIRVDECRNPGRSRDSVADAICASDARSVSAQGVTEAASLLAGLKNVDQLEGMPDALSEARNQDLHTQPGPRGYQVTDMRKVDQKIWGFGIELSDVGQVTRSSPLAELDGNLTDPYSESSQWWREGAMLKFESIEDAGSKSIVSGVAVSAAHSRTDDRLRITAFRLPEEGVRFEVGGFSQLNLQPALQVDVAYARTGRYVLNKETAAYAFRHLSGVRRGHGLELSEETALRAVLAARAARTLSSGNRCRAVVSQYKPCTSIESFTLVIWGAMFGGLAVTTLVWTVFWVQARGTIDYNSRESLILGLMGKVAEFSGCGKPGAKCSDIDESGGLYVIRIMRSDVQGVFEQGVAVDKHLAIVHRDDPREAVPYRDLREVGL